MVPIRQKHTLNKVYSTISLAVTLTCLKSPETDSYLLGYLLLCSEKGS